MNYKNITALIFTLCAWQIAIQTMDQQVVQMQEPLTSATARLFDAIENRLSFLVEHRLTGNPDVNALNNKGYTPLHLAIVLRLTTIIKKLIAHPGIDLNKKNRWQETPVYAALKEECDHDMIEALVTAGADINITSTQHQATPLEFAIDNCDVHQVELFLTKCDVSFETLYKAHQELESKIIKRSYYAHEIDKYNQIKQMLEEHFNPGLK